MQQIYGAKYGFSGIAKGQKDWVQLKADDLNGIQDKGGSILGVQGPWCEASECYDACI